MSNSNNLTLPLPSADATTIDLLPNNPLAGVYFPFTSGQLAALADERVASGKQGDDLENQPSTTDLSIEPQDPEIVAKGYVQYFQDRNTGEAWQRKALVYETK